MRVLSLFSGAGGMDMGLERAGHEIVGMCEIDKQARRVLAHHWPDIPLHDDVTTFDVGAFCGRVDLVAGGSPCQDLSVAGRRAGLDGQRSSLFWHQCRIADSVAAPWVLWENVAGAFSSNGGADFAAVLWGITGALPVVPDGGWRNMGICVGPKRTAVWRLLDARWFGVAQRRRRVFVVGGPTDGRWIEVLLESESCDRDTRPSATPGEDIAGTLGGGSGSRGWSADTERMTFLPVVGALTTKSGDRSRDAGTQGWVVPVSFGWMKAPCQGADVVEDGVASLRKSTHPAIILEDDRRTGLRLSSDVAPTLQSFMGTGGNNTPMVATPFVKVVRSGDRDADGNLPPEVWREEQLAPTLTTFDTGESRATVLAAVVAPTIIAANDPSRSPQSSEITQQVAAVHEASLAVRRLTPVECERLMGWPDDWTRWADDGSEIADSHRYRMCGNGVVSNVTEWIGKRLMDVAQ